ACMVISAEYNQAAIDTGRDARLAFDAAKVERDQATLESLFADEYTFRDPFGVVGNKQTTITNILAGKIRKDGFGRDGFETTEETIQIHGNTAVSTGVFS